MVLQREQVLEFESESFPMAAPWPPPRSPLPPRCTLGWRTPPSPPLPRGSSPAKPSMHPSSSHCHSAQSVKVALLLTKHIVFFHSAKCVFIQRIFANKKWYSVYGAARLVRHVFPRSKDNQVKNYTSSFVANPFLLTVNLLKNLCLEINFFLDLKDFGFLLYSLINILFVKFERIQMWKIAWRNFVPVFGWDILSLGLLKFDVGWSVCIIVIECSGRCKKRLSAAGLV